MSQHPHDAGGILLFLREMAHRCRMRSQNCFDLGAARELRSVADDLDAKAGSLETGDTVQKR
jgi:hypothetical protein